MRTKMLETKLLATVAAVAPLAAPGWLVELVAARPLDVPLYSREAKLVLPERGRLSQTVLRVARQALTH